MGAGTVRRVRRSGTTIVAAVVALGMVAACSSSGEEGEQAERTEQSPGPVPEVERSGDDTDPAERSDEKPAEETGSLTGTWEGTFTCAQGLSGLTLVLDDRGNGVVAGNVEYFPLPENESAPAGRYSVHGEVSSDSELQMDGVGWIEHGGDQPLAGLATTVDGRSDPEHLEGELVGDGCTTFSVDRTSTDPWFVGTWEGTYVCAQGATGLTLTVTQLANGGGITGTFEFYAVAENPGVPDGSFEVTGTYAGGVLDLVGGDWISRPGEYVTVDLRSSNELGIDPKHMTGTVTPTDPQNAAAGCTTFDIDRA